MVSRKGKSNKYFLNIINKRKNKKQTESLIDESGKEITDIKDIVKEAEKFYQKLYETQKEVAWDEGFINDIDIPTIKKEKYELIMKTINKEELANTLKQCKDSSPGSDGIT